MTNNPKTFDFIIVGGGSAGCVIANRLSENPKNNVLIIEAGPNENQHYANQYQINQTQNLKTTPEIMLNQRQINIPIGCGIGGSALIGNAIYIRGQMRDYNNWKKLGNQNWAWEDVLPFFRKSEKHSTQENAFHQKNGEWHVQPQKENNEILNIIRNAAAEIGIPKINDFNKGDNNGSAYYALNTKNNTIHTLQDAFINTIKIRKNLHIKTHAAAVKIILKNKKAKAVQIYDKKKKENKTFNATQEIILTAGAIGSPKILEHSGIGNPHILQSQNINVIHPLSGVGENLQDHLHIPITYIIKRHNETKSATMRVIKNAIHTYQQYDQKILGIFAKSNPARITPNLQITIQTKKQNIIIHATNLRPESRGAVHIKSHNFKTHPNITPNYLSTAADQHVTEEAVRLIRKIFNATTLEKFRPKEIYPDPNAITTEDIIKIIAQNAKTASHPVGTCKMGNDERAVVNQNLAVHGIKNLRIADASIMPTIPSGNTNAPTVMIAEKAAHMIKNNHA